MNKKIIFIVITLIIVSIISAYFILDYKMTSDQNTLIHNHPLVKNCIPAGPDEAVMTILIENQTHTFDLGNCIWNLKN